MKHFYEIKLRCRYDDWYRYLYITTSMSIDCLKDLTTDKVPEKVKMVIKNKNLDPLLITRINANKYRYCKYSKKKFEFGWRVDWEKEKF